MCTMTGNINSAAYFYWTNHYGLSWTHSGQLTCDLNGDMYFYYFQQTGFTKVTINSMGITIGCTPTIPLEISAYAASTQMYTYLNYGGVSGPGTYAQNYSIYCSYTVCASEFNSISDAQIKTNKKKLELGLDLILQLRPVSYYYKNKNRMRINIELY